MATGIAKGAVADTTTDEYWPPPQGEWTYQDYSRLPDNGLRYEVINGELIMTPAPVPVHQKIIANLYRHLWEYVQKQSAGEVFFAPIDVNLPDLASLVQPDLLFIATERLDIIKEKFIEGSPDLIMEILSAGSERQDRRVKFELYARAGVR